MSKFSFPPFPVLSWHGFSIRHGILEERARCLRPLLKDSLDVVRATKHSHDADGVNIGLIGDQVGIEGKEQYRSLREVFPFDAPDRAFELNL
jgi:hypothetical protein